MAQAAATKTKKKINPANCVHHWIIETPNGRESEGTCKRCGSTKSFANSNEQVMWEKTNTLRNDLTRNVRSTRTDESVLAEER